jgi:hypothetical protein
MEKFLMDAGQGHNKLQEYWEIEEEKMKGNWFEDSQIWKFERRQ